jgi:hypothetical protein
MKNGQNNSSALTGKPKAFWIISVVIITGITLAFLKRGDNTNVEPTQHADQDSTPSKPSSNGILDRVKQLGRGVTLATQEAKALSLEETIDQAMNHGSASARRSILDGIAVELARINPARATELVNQLLSTSKTSKDAPEFVKSFATALGKLGPLKAVEWAQGLPQDLQVLARDTIAKNWIANDTLAAADWIASIPDANSRISLTKSLAEHFKQRPSTPESADWAQRLAASPDAGQHLDAIARLWTRQSPTDSSEWALNLPEQQSRIQAAVGIAATLAETGIESAREWIASIPNEDGSQDLMINFLAYELDGKQQGLGSDIAKLFNHIYATEREGTGQVVNADEDPANTSPQP